MRRVTTFAVVSALLVTFCALGAWPHIASANPSPPPWEPDTTARGSLRFYDGHGDLVTAGNTGAVPFSLYTEASVDGDQGDDTASLWAFTPIRGASPATWRGESLSGPSKYPNANAPPRVNGTILPVATGQTGDLSLDAYVARHPNRETEPGYAGVYQLRLYTSQTGSSVSPYSVADVVVSGGTWTQTYPEVDSTTLSMLATPPSWFPGMSSIALVAKLTPATVGGTVTFYDGTSLLGRLPGYAIQASLDGITLTPGHHVLTTTFHPDSTFKDSSASVAYDFGAATPGPQQTTTTLTMNPLGRTVEEGTTVTFTAAVDPADAPGSITFYDGPQVMATVPLYQGGAAFATNALKPSEHPHLYAAYDPSSKEFLTSRSDDARLKVVKKPTGDPQTVKVVVPGTRVKGVTKSRGGALGKTGIATLGVLTAGLLGVAIGSAVRSSARKRRSPEPGADRNVR